MTDLGTLGGPETNASSSNNGGQICGWAETKSGETHAVLWMLKRGRRTCPHERERALLQIAPNFIRLVLDRYAGRA